MRTVLITYTVGREVLRQEAEITPTRDAIVGIKKLIRVIRDDGITYREGNKYKHIPFHKIDAMELEIIS